MVQQLFAQATAFHNAGDLLRAEALYRQILALAPDHPDALHLLGRLALGARNAPAAADLIGRAVRLRPRIAEYQASLAEAQRALGRPAEAVEALRRAVRLKPESARIQYGYGMALYEAGQPAPSIQAFRRAVARDPAMLAAHRALGAALAAQGEFAPAADSFRAVLRLAPRDAEGFFNLGCALQGAGDPAGAEAQFRAAIDVRPDYLQAVNNLGVLLQALGRLEEAEAWLRRAAEIDPAQAQTFGNLGLVLRDLSRFADAEAAFRTAHALAPNAATLCCIGNALRDQAARVPGALAASEEALRQAVASDPENREAHIGLAFARLLGGDLQAGWPDFAWRGAADIGRARVAAMTPAPAWKGQPVGGAVLIYAEQGAGDFVQMARYVALAAARARRVVLLVPPGLRRLAHAINGATQVCVHGETLPPIEAVCADLDLPQVFETNLDTIPQSVPYLTAEPEAVASWQARLAALPGRKIGLAWAGNPAYAADRQRSVPISALCALAEAGDVTWISLQPGMAPPPGLPMVDWSGELVDFAATAALIMALDLVVSVDSAVAHLAGALGAPVWLLNRYAPDWRWLLHRPDTPWYPTLKQFRQPAPEDWPQVLSDLVGALNELQRAPNG